MLDGYYNRPDLSQKTPRDGLYWSGDLGFLSDDELYVIGRKKDLIIVAGENIYPQDIEEIVSAHAAIYEGRVIAFGNYNSSLGTEEIVVVAEVRENSSLEKARAIKRELRSAINAELGVAVGSKAASRSAVPSAKVTIVSTSNPMAIFDQCMPQVAHLRFAALRPLV